MSSNLKPWHLWGVDQVVNPISGGPTSGTSSSNQLVNVKYHRPETWRFLFVARIQDFSGPGGSPISPGSALVRFDVTTGVGRTSQKLPGFCTFKFQWPAMPTVGNVKYATAVFPPLIDDALGTAGPEIDTLVGEDIQVSATAQLVTPTNGDTMALSVSAMFTPNVHLRPDWEIHHFVGELGGT